MTARGHGLLSLTSELCIVYLIVAPIAQSLKDRNLSAARLRAATCQAVLQAYKTRRQVLASPYRVEKCARPIDMPKV
eukprot:scaffold106265_cov60-Phaeocystis_antarctica.AAC.1